MQPCGGEGEVGLGALAAGRQHRRELDGKEQRETAARQGLQRRPSLAQGQRDPKRRLGRDPQQEQRLDQGMPVGAALRLLHCAVRLLP